MKILITGAGGFIGKNLKKRLENEGYSDVEEFVRGMSGDDLKSLCGGADFVFHLAGVNRPKKEEEFSEGNEELTKDLVDCLEAAGRKIPVIITSSIQAGLNNPYGISKRGAEKALYEYGRKTGAPVMIYRLPNVFGKWSRPGYNSAVATFCHNVARGLPIEVNEPGRIMHLIYIDDVMDEFMSAMKRICAGEKPKGAGKPFCDPESPVYDVRLQTVADIIESFPSLRESLELPELQDPLVSALYSTYLSFLPSDGFAYDLDSKQDERGSFTEFLKTPDRGQVSVNISHPGIVKGQHWHDSKNEKFLVVHGKGCIRFRQIGGDEITEYHVSGDKLQVVDIPPGYAHSIENEGTDDMVTLMWANESFDPEKPDTYREEV